MGSIPIRATNLIFIVGSGLLTIFKMGLFQVIFTPICASELSRIPREAQLNILKEFRDLPRKVIASEMSEFGKLEREGRVLYRLRVGEYRVYFERHPLGVIVHRILNRHTLKDFLYRSGLGIGEDEALEGNPQFWKMIESAGKQAKEEQ